MQKFGYKKIGDNRFREDKGFCYEDFEPGVTIEHSPGRTITSTDNSWMSLLAMNQSPLHIDAVYCERTEFKQLLVSSLVTFNIVNGMTVHTVSHKGIANLGWDRVRLLHPVFVGDTLFAESTVLEKRESKSRPTQGIVKVQTIGKNQDGVAVIEFERTVLVEMRMHPFD